MGDPCPLEVIGLSKRYGAHQAVSGLDLSVGRGEILALLGPSGCGKTTTLRLIAGFERPDAGRIELDARDVARLPPYARDVNTVFQDYALFPHMTVAENVAYGLRARRVPAPEARERAAAALTMVRLDGFGERRPGMLSGGQRQRVALARALVNRPRVLLLDEPLGALDLKLRHHMQTELKRLQRETHITFLYVTHDQEEALTMSDRVAVFNRGRIEQVGTPFALYEQPATEFVAGFVGISNLLREGGRALVLRPEKIRLLPPGAALTPSERGVDAVVRDAAYLGMFTRYALALRDGTTLIAVEQNGATTGAIRLPPGTDVQAVWRQDAPTAVTITHEGSKNDETES